MSDRSLRTCRYCSHPIRFVPTATGRAVPVDPDPRPGGTVLLSATRAGILARELDRAEARRVGSTLHVKHRTTCPARQNTG